MCGIVGYVGPREAAAVLVDCLSRLEYRGYDSAGLAVLNGRGVETRKLAGRIAALRDRLPQDPVHRTRGGWHTRRATHRAPPQRDAHPPTHRTRAPSPLPQGINQQAH